MGSPLPKSAFTDIDILAQWWQGMAMGTDLVLVPSALSVPQRRRARIDLITSGAFRHDDLLGQVGRSLQAQGCLVRRQRLEGICLHRDTSFQVRGWPVWECLPIGADKPKSQFKTAFSYSVLDATHVVVFTVRFDESERFIRRWGRRFQWSGIKFAAVMIGDGNPRMLTRLATAANGVCYQIDRAPDIAAAMPSLHLFAGAT
jgi:hypothetical protein